MRGMQRTIVKVLILVPLAVFASAFAIGPGGLVSYTPATRVGVHSVLAFWVAIPAALSVLAYQRKQSRANIMLMSALAFLMIIHIGSAAKNLLRVSESTIERVLTDSVADVLELALLGVLLGGACVCMIRKLPTEEQRIPNLIALPLLIVLPLAIYGGIWFLVLPILSIELLTVMSWVLGAIAIVGFLIAVFLIPQFKESDTPIDPGYLISSVLLFSVSAIAILFTLSDPSTNWEYAETLQMAGFLLLALALGVPFLRRAGFRRRTAYGFVIALILMAYIPLLITTIIESLSLYSPLWSNNLVAYFVIHIGAASLSVMMAILLYIYPKKRTSWNHYPLILLFGMWAGVAIVLVFLLLLPPTFTPFGEPITPITIGSLLTLGLLYLTTRWTTQPPVEREQSPTIFQLLLVLAGLITIIVIGECVNQFVFLTNPTFENSPVDNVLILGSNLFIMFAFAYIIFLLSEESKGHASIELYIAFFLAMWILPNILKSYYVTWTAGWWISEILLFIGLIAGPPLLTWLYVRSMHQVEDSHRRANMYADLLMHDVSNYNQMVMTTLELLGSDDILEEQRQRLADDGCKVISFSEQLISNVRLLSESDRLEPSRLEYTNLVSTIVSALDLFSQRVGSGELIIEFKPEKAHVFVMANDLLVHIFLNILYSALECRVQGETVSIDIQLVEHAGEEFWQINIKAPGKDIEEEDDYSSSTLALTAAELMTVSLNGHFEIERYERVDKCEGRLFTIRLRAANR